jgi:GTPase SAR1 family protein
MIKICPQDTFAGMRDLYYKTGDGFLLVYSITDKSSLEDVKERFASLLSARVSTKYCFFFKR